MHSLSDEMHKTSIHALPNFTNLKNIFKSLKKTIDIPQGMCYTIYKIKKLQELY